MARVSCYAGDGDYFVTPTSSKKRRRVSGSMLVPTSLDGASSLFRHDGQGGSAARVLARARSAAAKVSSEAAKQVSNCHKNAECRVAKAEKKTAAALKKAKVAEVAAAKSEAEKSALFSGDVNDPRLTLKGRKLAAVLNSEGEVKRIRLQRQVVFNEQGRLRAEKLAADSQASEVKFDLSVPKHGQLNMKIRSFGSHFSVISA